MDEKLDLSGDRPLRPDGVDHLGINELAVRLATILKDRSLRDGFVIGVEGKWGAGKSTLIKRTIDRLTAEPTPPVIIEFNPWMVGDKRDLIAEFFVSLDEALAQYSARSQLKGKAKKAALSAKEGLQKYSKHMATGAKLLSAASIVVPQLKLLADFLEKAAPGLDSAIASQPLHEQKSELEVALRELPDPIIVFIDDTERLDPPEVMEILRLLRAVGDLPNIVYVVCYDRDALVRNIGLALQAVDCESAGEAYLEKIVQASLTIPKPEDFALRRWFLREVLSIAGPSISEETERLKYIIDTDGGRLLETPRDVVRTLNSLKLVWPAIRNFVDVPDLVWLHLIKLKRPRLYAWLERYLNGFAEVARGTASATDAEEQMKDLLQIIEADYNPDSLNFFRLKEIVPGLQRVSAESGSREWSAFRIDVSEVNQRTRKRRLGSPHYYRYYFALGQNSGFLSGEIIASAAKEIENCSSKFGKRLKETCQQRFEDGELHFPVLLDSLRPSISALNDTQSKFLLDAIVSCADLAIQNAPDPYLNGRRSVSTAIGLFKNVVGMTPVRRSWLLEMVERGESLSFLAYLLRDLQNAGRLELNLEEDFVADLGNRFWDRVVMLGDKVMDCPTPYLVIRVSQRSVNQDDLFKAHLNKLLAKDENLIRLIGSEGARGVRSSSRGSTTRPLDLSVFVDISGDENIASRIEKIIESRFSYPNNLQAYIDSIAEGLQDAKNTEPW